MPQGYKYAISFDGQFANFKRLDVREEAISINVASRYLPDGTLNEGFNAEEGDLVMLVFTLEELQDGDDNTDLFLTYLAGNVYDTVAYAISYDAVELYTGTGFYVREAGTSGSIPGEASFRFVFSSRNAFA
jgi:hypothetical protein